MDSDQNRGTGQGDPDHKLHNQFDNLYWDQFSEGGWTESEKGYNFNSYWLIWRREIAAMHEPDKREDGTAVGPTGVVPDWWDRKHPTNFNWWRWWYGDEWKLEGEAIEAEMRKDMPEFAPDYVNPWAPKEFGGPPKAAP